MVFYTQTIGVIINVVLCVVALTAIGVSLYFMSARSGLSWPAIFQRYGICFAVQIMALLFEAGLTLLLALFMDII